jgi:hypothetical protein
MDLNQLLHAHQLAMVGQARAPDRARRAAYCDAISLLACRIRRARKAGGVDVLSAVFVTGEPIVVYHDR